MKKYIIVIWLLILSSLVHESYGQRFVTRNGHIRFFSEAPLENIEALNKQVSSALDLSNGEFVFRVLIRSFHFEKALMQEHFNENYMESHKFPNATFNGKLTDFKKIDLKKDGIYKVNVEGDLTIRGITKKLIEPGTIEVKGGKLHAKSKFTVAIADFDITIPRAVANNIARNIDIYVDVILEVLKK